MVIIILSLSIIVAFIIIIRQVQELRKIRNGISSKNYNFHFPQSAMCIVYDQNLTIHNIINPQSIVLFGFQPEGLIGKSIYDLEKIVKETYQDALLQNKLNLLKVQSTKHSLQYEYSIENPEKETQYILCDIKFEEGNQQLYCYMTPIDSSSLVLTRQSFINDFLIRMAELLSTGVYVRSVTSTSRNYVLFNKKIIEYYETDCITSSPHWKQEEEDREDEMVLQSDTALTFNREFSTPDGAKRFFQVTKQKLMNSKDAFYISATVTDLTELISKNKTIEEFSLNLQLALDTSQASVWCYDPDAKTFKTIHGQIFDKIITFDECYENLHADSKDAFLTTMNHLLSGQSSRETIKLHFKNTESSNDAYYESEIVAIQSKEGKVIKLVGTQKDITESIKEEKKYEDFFLRQEIILSMLPIGVEIYDKEGWMIFQNQVDKEIFEMGNVDIHQINIFNNPNLSEHFKEQLRKGEDAFLTVEYNFLKANSSNYIQSRNNGTKHLSGSAKTIYNPNGEILCYTCVVQDVSEILRARKRIEENNLKLSIVVDNSSIFPWDYDCEKGVFIPYCEEETSNQYRQTLEEFLEVMDSKDHDKLKEVWDILKNSRNESFSVNTRFRLLNQTEWQYCTIFGIPFEFDEHGIPTKYTGFRKDTTEQKRINRELEEAKEKAEQSNLLKSAFLANMSHEIRTPLNAIIGFSELITDATNEDEKKEYKNIIATNSNMLLNLINDILDLSKIESGYLEMHPGEIDFSELFNELHTSFSLQMKNGVELKCLNPYSSCVSYNLDKQRVLQIITNFISNAIKFTSTGSITTGYEVIDGGIHLWVSDTGIGISEENRRKVFQRFQKFDTFAQGTGLGLSICKAIVDKLNGKIGFHSQVGNGTTFWVWLPCNINFSVKNQETTLTNRNDILSTENIKSSDNKENKEKKPIRILVAEDNDSNFLLLKTILKKYVLIRVTNGRLAVEKARNEEFDLILMDMKMPEMDGLEATSEIRKFNTKAHIIALTANAFDNDKQEAIAAGCNDLIPKPINKEKLIETIDSFYRIKN